jgi:hypothetical protein
VFILARVFHPTDMRPTPAQIRTLVIPSPLFKPADAATFLGVSEDCVTTHMLRRPDMFPDRAPGLRRRYEWKIDDYIDVLVALCVLSPLARRHTEMRIFTKRITPFSTKAQVRAKKIREKFGKSSGIKTA